MNRLKGLGAPVDIAAPSAAGAIDPTLDSCCQREILANRHANALQQVLEENQHVILQQERIRRNLVNTLKFSGCRCCYDPDSDGTGDYRALEDLRLQREREKEIPSHLVDDTVEQDGNDSGLGRVYDSHNSSPVDSRSGGTQAETTHENDDSDDEYDYLLDDDLPLHDTELQRIEANRLAQLQVQLLERQVLQQHGYGVHRQMHPTRVLRAAGLGSDATATASHDCVVLHLYDPDSITSAQLDLYFEEELARKYAGTKFLRCGGRSCLLMDSAGVASQALGRLQADRDIPALVAIRHGVVIACCPRLEGLHDRSAGVLLKGQVTEWLERAGVLNTEPPRDVCRIRPEEDALMDYLMQQKKTDERERERLFECGVEGCQKTFYHEHVGIETEQQSGLLLTEQEILGGTGG